MAILSPSNLEELAYGVQGWNYILTVNLQLLNTYLTKLWGPTQATYALGARAVTDYSGTCSDPTDATSDPSAITQNTLTDSTGGTPGTTISAISGSGADAAINKALASIITELNAVKTDLGSVRTQLIDCIDYCDSLKSSDIAIIDYADAIKGKLNTLLGELRTTNGCGVLDD